MKDINSATKVTAIDASDQLLVSDGGTALAKIDYNVLAKAIIEQYTGSSVAGKAQSLKAALDALNSNSEVGLGAVSVQPLVYRLVCTNGMVVNDFGERRAHVGRAVKALEDSFQLYSDETMEAEDKAFMLKLRDTTLAALEEARFAQSVGRLQESTQARITGRVQDVVELTGKAYDLNQPEQDSILNYLIQGGDLSLYGLSNAITRASQDVDSYDRATTLEGIGWQVATMPETQWKEINSHVS